MSPSNRPSSTRRALLGGLAAVPLLDANAWSDEVLPPSQAFAKVPPPITSADQVLNVMEFEPLARSALPPAHFGYIATGADEDRTVARNHEAYSAVQIRSRRFVDLSHFDTATTVFGKAWPSPLYLSAVSSLRAFHPEAEIAVARAARSRSTPLMLSTGSSSAVEDVAAALGAPHWQQLYPTDDWVVTAAIVDRAQRAGCSAIVLTVDSAGRRNNETLKRAMAADSRTCTACHVNNSHDMWKSKPMFAGLDVSKVGGLVPPDLDARYLDRLRAIVTGKLLVKGVVTAEDATIALEHGVDGIVVSNHGGRNEETLRATIDCLPEVVRAARGQVPVFVDGGIRRGTDVFKAVALGATAVGIGRPLAWGLAAFGQAGVEAVIDILNRELVTIMKQAGTPTVADIGAARVIKSL